MSAYQKCLEHLEAGSLPAVIPVVRDGEVSLFAVASPLKTCPRTREAAYSKSQAARLAAAFVVLHEARALARRQGYELTA